MAVRTDPQLQLDERAIIDEALERALEKHLRAKDDAAEARGVVKQARKEIDAEVAKHGEFPVDTAIRVGRFRIVKRRVEGRAVSFDTDPRDQIRITLVDEA